MEIDISIIIVNYNVRHFLRRTVESIYASDIAGLSIEIFVVDNASIDGSVEMVTSQFSDVHLIANQDNVGFSTANNQAIAQSKGKYVLILNPDTVIEEHTLGICHAYMERHMEVGAVGVRMIDGSGNFLAESKRAIPTVWNSFTKLSGLSSWFPKSSLFNGYALGHLSENDTHKIDVLCGAFMFVRRAAIDKVGMFDERFFMYAEDIDWSRRIVEGGYEIHYIPDTTIIHYKGESTKKASLSYVKTFYGAMSLYVEKHYSGPSGKFFSKILKLAITVRAAISGLRRLVTEAIQPILDFALVFLGIYGFSKFWATWYFDDSLYYEDTNLLAYLLAYTSAWIVSLWLFGYYKKHWKKIWQV